MEQLERKKINGRYYYYYSKWERKDGRCRRIWQKYLGKLEDIVKAVDGGGPPPNYAEVFEYGLSTALWNECCSAEVVSSVDDVCCKRKQGLSVGQYLAVAAINRAIKPVSKKSIWEWFNGTSLRRQLPEASADALSSQRFWDHMGRITRDHAREIWKRVLSGVVAREGVDLSSISYDGTNFYTFINSFNTKCDVAKRGKNKQGRGNLRQVSYALFCTADGHVPLMYEVYEGNRNDAKQFPEMLKRFEGFLKDICAPKVDQLDTTIVFDKGNNSADNFKLIDSLKLKFVGSVKLGQVKELAEVSNGDSRFCPCQDSGLEGAKAFRVKRKLFGKERTLVVTYNSGLANAQWLTLQNDISAAMAKIEDLQQRLQQRASGLIKRGKSSTVESVQRQCATFRKRQHMKALIRVDVTEKNGVPCLHYELDSTALSHLSDTWLGKNILITNRHQWNDERIILAYRSQYIIEDVFKEMKDRQTGNWWPMFHWTDRMIEVHGLYCSIAVLLRALAYRRIQRAGITISMKQMLASLHDIKEVVNVFQPKRKGKKTKRQTVLSKTNERQQAILDVLNLQTLQNQLLG